MSHSVDDITARLARMTPAQLELINGIVDAFELPIEVHRLPKSHVVTAEFSKAFGDILKLHHTLSDDYLDKHRFEMAMVRVLNATGRRAERPGRCNPGHDITVDGVCWSLKTQGDRGIKPNVLHISKFMELGKGRWENERDLRGLRDRFLAHINSYERIFQLRHFQLESSEHTPAAHRYELVEIPKALLEESAGGKIEMVHTSKQSPKPGYCTVTNAQGETKFRLYFDGGTERKLQIKNLQKSLCVVHGSWEF